MYSNTSLMDFILKKVNNPKNDIEVFTDKDLSAKMEASVLPALL